MKRLALVEGFGYPNTQLLTMSSNYERTAIDSVSVGLLRESVLHRYALYCNVVRGRLLIDQQKQSVNIQDLSSGGSALV